MTAPHASSAHWHENKVRAICEDLRSKSAVLHWSRDQCPEIRGAFPRAVSPHQLLLSVDSAYCLPLAISSINSEIVEIQKMVAAIQRTLSLKPVASDQRGSDGWHV